LTEKQYSLFFGFVIAGLRWAISIGSKFVKTAPIFTFAIVVAMLASQISLLLAMLLPLKVIILLGSENIPSYFPQSWRSLDRSTLTVVLASGAVIFYMFYLLAERVIDYFAVRGASLLLDKSKKINLFANQEDVAKKAYSRYSHSLAGLVFVFTALAAMSFIYIDLVLVTIAYVLFALGAIYLVFTCRPRSRDDIENNLSLLMTSLGAIGFLLAFVYMVSDFLWERPPSVIAAVISLLLVRQVMNRAARVVIDFTSLYKDRQKIDALFFHGKKLHGPNRRKDSEFWALLDRSYLEKWIPATLVELTGDQLNYHDSTWHPSDIPNVVFLEVDLYAEKKECTTTFIFKLFNSNRKNEALHEADLFMGHQSGDLPSPDFIGAGFVSGYHCHVFEGFRGDSMTQPALPSLVRSMAESLIAYVPSEALVKRYSRSKPLLGHRLSRKMIDRLRLVSRDDTHVKNLLDFEDIFDRLCERIDSLPAQIVNPDIQADTLVCSADHCIGLLHWGRWSIEPLGAGWPSPGRLASDQDLDSLQALVDTLHNNGEVSRNAKLAALLSSFERFYNRQQYLKALNVLPRILAYFES